MADNDSWPQNPADFDPWSASSSHFDDAFSDPADVRARELRRIRRVQMGFATLGFSLIVASLFSVGWLTIFFLDLRQFRAAIQSWDFAEESVIVLCSFVGAGLLWGHWPNASWRRRSGLLLMMCFTDVILWSIDHATTLGLSNGAIGHEYFRKTLGTALGWWQFALIASLSAEMATLLGEPRAADLGRAARSLTMVGASIWFAYFYSKTNWSMPLWPLRERQFNLHLFMMMLGTTILSTIVLIQVTLLCLLAGRTCARAAREIKAEDRTEDAFLSRSETGWNDLHRNDPDRLGR